MFDDNLYDNNDILKEMRKLYIRSNSLLRTFGNCSVQIKKELFRSFCTAFYCSHLWTHHSKAVHSKIRVAYNNIYRKLFRIPYRSSASRMFAENNVPSFEALIRSHIFAFISRLSNSENELIRSVNNNFICKYSIWDKWYEIMF